MGINQTALEYQLNQLKLNQVLKGNTLICQFSNSNTFDWLLGNQEIISSLAKQRPAVDASQLSKILKALLLK